MAAADVIKGIVFEGPDLRVSLGVGEKTNPGEKKEDFRNITGFAGIHFLGQRFII